MNESYLPWVVGCLAGIALVYLGEPYFALIVIFLGFWLT